MPPPPPPPPPVPQFGGVGGKTSGGKPPDRNALLSQIRKGRSLKKVETNDRSAPLVHGSGNKPSASPSIGGGGGNGATSGGANGPMPFIPPGGLFAHGIPKLRPTGSRAGDSVENQIPQRNMNRTSDSGITSESIASYNQSAVGMSRSQPPSPLMRARQLSNASSVVNRNFPSDLNIKGPAPAPPPASQKPKLTNQMGDTDARNNAANIRRSLSQTGLGSKMRPARPPPNIRPPPPPRAAPAVGQNRPPPPPPLKPPNVMRRQSFGVADASTVSSAYNGVRLPMSTVVPPPPPRNNSVPNSLNHVPNSSSSPTAVHVNKMTTAPPPPPSRPVSAGARPPLTRPPPPPVSRSAAPPPPPPPHRYPAPPSQLKATASFSAGDSTPKPPARVSSVMSLQATDSVSSFESRFFHKFQSADNFPPPDRYMNVQKTYPSRVMLDRSTRRQPPPPPPLSGSHSNLSRSQSVSHGTRLHIQLDTRVFANNTAHC